ncbi:MAG TPA: phosphoribosyltransferase family protein [Gaiellaceae bacterium]|nr:phosphoribosyltransferase family protein [Gaiellaceae bacterium]
MPAETVLFPDRREAGKELAELVASEAEPDTVVLALSHGGIEVAAEVARELKAPLDMLVVRKIRYPGTPRRVLGAVAPGYAIYVHTRADLSSHDLYVAASKAREELAHVDSRIHRRLTQVDVTGREVMLVDDGITTGARMITAARWARTQRARRIVAAVPVSSADAAEDVRRAVDLFVCPHELDALGAVSIRYAVFDPVDDDEAVALLEHATLSAAV